MNEQKRGSESFGGKKVKQEGNTDLFCFDGLISFRRTYLFFACAALRTE